MYQPNAVLPATGLGAGLLQMGAVGLLTLLIGLFAIYMATGAAVRIVPAGFRRRFRR